MTDTDRLTDTETDEVIADLQHQLLKMPKVLDKLSQALDSEEQLKTDVTNYKHLIIAIIFVMITMTTILMYSNKKSRLYTAFFVESLPIFWLLTLLSFYINR